MSTVLNVPRSVPAKYRAVIRHWDDERDMGNSLIITLEKGFCFGCSGEHVYGFDTVREAITGIKGAISCKCSTCVTNPSGV